MCTWLIHIHVHVCVGADVDRTTTNNDHTVLSLACAGGHLNVVQYLLLQGADPSYVLKVATPCVVSDVDIFPCRTTPQC